MYVKRESTTRGVIVSRHQSGEGSVRVLVYTEALGLVSALAKSAREERSKLRAHLMPGTFGTFTFVKGKDVWRVTGATETENIYFSLSDNAHGKEATARTLGSVRQFVHGEGADAYLFDVLWGFVSAIRATPEKHISLAEFLAVLRILSALGYVREDAATKDFLNASYDAEMLARAEGARANLVRTINEAISASGL